MARAIKDLNGTVLQEWITDQDVSFRLTWDSSRTFGIRIESAHEGEELTDHVPPHPPFAQPADWYMAVAHVLAEGFLYSVS